MEKKNHTKKACKKHFVQYSTVSDGGVIDNSDDHHRGGGFSAAARAAAGAAGLGDLGGRRRGQRGAEPAQQQGVLNLPREEAVRRVGHGE
jgi:hypothetical protein